MIVVNGVNRTISGYFVACYWTEFRIGDFFFYCGNPKYAFKNHEGEWRDQDTGEALERSVADKLEAKRAFNHSDKTYV